MTAPERIWAEQAYNRWWDMNPGGDAEEYVRADIADALAAKVERLTEALEFYRDEWRRGRDAIWGTYTATPSDSLRDDKGERARAALEST